MDKRYVLALDQGTTSSRAILFDRGASVIAVAQQPFPQIYPQPGWVEHDPAALWETQLGVARAVLDKAGVRAGEVAAIGLTNQRETTLVWERETGRPLGNAIVWQCRRTAGLCDALKARGFEPHVRERTGLVIDAYFSATKLQWILDQHPGARERARRGELLFGTVDTWLLWKLTGGRVHATEVSNASRTMLFDIDRLCWDETLLEALDIPAAMLPEVRPSSGVFGHTDSDLFGGVAIPIAGCAGDQQAALFGQSCFEPGMVKSTYGTGCFMLMNTGTKRVPSKHGLLTTIAWGLDGRVDYALEGSIFVAGAAMQWLRDELRVLDRVEDSEALAQSVPDSGGVVVVPAFVGLGAPHWDMYARGTVLGLTRGSNRAHLVRATLESIGLQAHDVLAAMQEDAGIALTTLKVDGGAAANGFLMQFQADVLGVPVERPAVNETTAMGAAFLAGLAVGVWRDTAEIAALWQRDRRFAPAMAVEQRERIVAGWRRAVQRSRAWIEPGD
ncbi:glycerol kinase GlpK [Silanimonas sp.]|uniref:glycerol kinase GlpK n=1 Tax=Silanimonas sp. TaxID=1929290 RepID=UPI0022C48EC7|nr:glycerol kinase GlpK [Silanimonas sp.]MCZ8115245.1 glycerol kinase GlpK [Silanimonas sp.]